MEGKAWIDLGQVSLNSTLIHPFIYSPFMASLLNVNAVEHLLFYSLNSNNKMQHSSQA